MCHLLVPFILQPYVLESVLVLDSVDWSTSVNMLLNFPLKPWWRAVLNESCSNNACSMHWFPRLFPYETEMQHTGGCRWINRAGGSIEYLTNKYIPVGRFSWPAFLRADLWVDRICNLCWRKTEFQKSHVQPGGVQKWEWKLHITFVSRQYQSLWKTPVSSVVPCKLGCPQGLKDGYWLWD